MLRVAVLTRRGSGREINQDRVVVGDTVVNHNPPTTTMFALGCPSVVAAHKQPATVTPQGHRDGILMIPPRDSKHEVD